MARDSLPNRRHSENINIESNGIFMSMTVGYYADGRPGEVFVSDIKSGVMADAITRDAAVMLSLGLQHGVPLQVMQHAVTRNLDGTPSSFMGSLIDHLVKEQEKRDEK